MSAEKENKILNVVKAALGGDIGFFNVEKSEVLSEEDNYLSMTVCISPKPDAFNRADMQVKPDAEKCYVQIDTFDDEFNLMVGEDGDHELDVTYGNIYAQLYWNEVIRES